MVKSNRMENIPYTLLLLLSDMLHVGCYVRTPSLLSIGNSALPSRQAYGEMGSFEFGESLF